MAHYELRSNTTSTRSIRTGPGVRNPKLPAPSGDLISGNVALAGATQDDVFIYPADVPDSTQTSGFIARSGDTWRKVYQNNGVPVSGWIAEIHLGQTLLSKILIPGTEPPPSPTLPEMPYVITLGDDITYAKVTITGVLRPK